MEFIHKAWNRYLELIHQNCTDDLVADTSLHYWQNRLFAASVAYLIPLSIIAIIPGLYMAYITELKGLMVVDSIAMLSILSVAFLPGLSVYLRKIIFNGMLYLVSATLLFYLGSHGPGLLYLLAITIFIVLSLDKIYGYLAFAMNTLICIGIGFSLYYGVGNFVIMDQYQVDSWIAVSTNLIFLSGVSVLLIPVLFNGLQSALIQENNLRSEVETQKGQLKDTIDQLNSKNQELEQFAYTASHDLKEPLRMIKSFMQLLERNYSEKLDDKAQRYINFAVDGAQRMTKSIDELLEYSRIGRLYNTSNELDSQGIVQEVLRSLEADIEDQQAEINVSNLPMINVVPVTFKMLVRNMITNALKYQPVEQKPVISINAQDIGDHWKFSFKDNGIGIDNEYHEEIFGIFRRLHPRDSYSGTGMGLAISKKIVEQHGGKIWVESEEGKGSTFYFTIAKRKFI